MTILCLHGAFGSAEKFKVQLGPVVEAVQKLGSIDFKWIDGGHKATPPPNFDNYFGAAPHYRFFDFDGVSALDDMVSKIRQFPVGLTAEDTIRRLIGEEEVFSSRAVTTSMDRIFKILDENPQIDGLLGYSEGSTLASTIILEERRRWEEEGRPRHIKHAIFFAGWPPVRILNGSIQCLLADECEDVIDVPTCHIIGCSDPYIQGTVALFSMCDEETATLFDHGKGHTVPRDAKTIQELALAIQGTVDKGSQGMK